RPPGPRTVGPWRYGRYCPPLTCSVWPVMCRAWGEARKTATAAMSSGRGMRPSGPAAGMAADSAPGVPWGGWGGSGRPGGVGVAADAVGGELQRHGPRHRDDAALGRRVVGAAHRPADGHRREVHDRAGPTAGDHRPRGGLGAEERALEVDVEDVVPVGLGHVE